MPTTARYFQGRSLLKLFYAAILALTSTGQGIALISANQLSGRNTINNGAVVSQRGGSIAAPAAASLENDSHEEAQAHISGDPSLVRLT